jgi:hypothetical protein
MEINFVDRFSCNGYRFKGTARIGPKAALDFVGLVALILPCSDRYRPMVVMYVTNELPIITPAYDAGARQSGLRKQYKAYFQLIQPNDWSMTRLRRRRALLAGRPLASAPAWIKQWAPLPRSKLRLPTGSEPTVEEGGAGIYGMTTATRMKADASNDLALASGMLMTSSAGQQPEAQTKQRRGR